MIANKPEIVTQKRIINMFKDPDLLGYEYLGDWKDRENNSNIEKELLEKFLKDKYDSPLIKKAIVELEKVTNDQNKKLYNINKEMYDLLRYGIKIKDVGENSKTLWLINWEEPLKNDFYIAEEVTIKSQNTKRPDIVLYVNGIALVVLELKRSSVSVAQGIRQNLDNQKQEFIKNFFATIQLVMAGSDSEGLRYGVIDTEEKYYLSWKEETPIQKPLDSHLYAMCQKERLLEIIHDFIVFDKGIKKICRHNQYFGVKKAQESLRKEEGGILWHTQGSGKSLIMIWLAKWIRENRENKPRVLIITDRKELDDQIEGFFMGVDEKIIRTTSGKDLVEKLDKNDPWLICSLIHKFRENNNSEHDDYLEDVFANLDKDFKAKGNLHVFIDECHRTQSGKLHDAMKKLIPNAVVIGFTGTPLLRTNKQTSLEKFGKYIHTYKYDEAVEDKVVLDLRYEARDIEQNLTSPEKVDQWFEASTKGLTSFAKIELKKNWGTLQKVFSSKQRLEKIVGDIIFDMKMENRLMSGKGNALLVASSIYQACRYYEVFQKNNFKKCAIITSYNGDINSIKGETVSTEEETEAENMYEIYKNMLADYHKIGIGENDPEKFERRVKELFIKEPKQMKLLIVVSKLLTGFDAPPATYLYIDKKMSDHGLFQAICRVNRLDGEDKEYGYIIDYKDLFKSIERSVSEYTSDAFEGFDSDDVKGLLKNRLVAEKERLDEVLENIQTLCEPVKPPKGLDDYYEYFCGSSNDLDNTEKLKESSQQRFMYYKITSSLVRAYSSLANNMQEAGYSNDEAIKIKSRVKDYEGVKKAIKLRSGEFVDLKRFEPEMRHLIDNYIDAEDSKKVSVFEDLTLVELIVKSGISTVINNFPQQVRKNNGTVAEVIDANVRKLITEEKPTNPKFYEKMSTLLDEIILDRKKGALDYEAYLKKISELCRKLKDQFSDSAYPNNINSKPRMTLYDNLDNNEELAIKLDEAIVKNKPDGWKGDTIKERMVKIAIEEVLGQENINDEELAKMILGLAREQKEY
jgi:type I restriction enzyme, R subunit